MVETTSEYMEHKKTKFQAFHKKKNRKLSFIISSE